MHSNSKQRKHEKTPEEAEFRYKEKNNMEEKKMFSINGMEQNDLGALTPEQQEKLNEFKVTLFVFS